MENGGIKLKKNTFIDHLTTGLMVILFTVSVLSLTFEILIYSFVYRISNVYTSTQYDVIMIMITSFNLCISSIYLLVTNNKLTVIYDLAKINEVAKDISSDDTLNKNDVTQKILLKALKGNNYKAMKVLLKFNELNQTELGARANIPKSTLSRIVTDFEKRGLIIRYKNGMSKMIKLSDEFLTNGNQ